MRRILIGLALITVLTACGDTSPFASPRYQIVKGTNEDFLLDTKTGRTWRPKTNSDNDYGWSPIYVFDYERSMKEKEREAHATKRRTPPQGVTPEFPWNLYNTYKRKSEENKIKENIRKKGKIEERLRVFAKKGADNLTAAERQEVLKLKAAYEAIGGSVPYSVYPGDR